MSDRLQQLDSNEAVLLMYLADELTAQERGEVDAMLNRDAALRAQLEKLCREYALAEQALSRLDQITPPPIPDAVAVRQATRLIQQWQARQLHHARRQRLEQAEQSLRFAWWIYPLATAAAIALALLVWWTNLDNLHEPPYVDTGRGWGGMTMPGLTLFESAVDDDPPAVEEWWAGNLERSFDVSDDLLSQAIAVDPLDLAEEELLALRDRKSVFPDEFFVAELLEEESP